MANTKYQDPHFSDEEIEQILADIEADDLDPSLKEGDIVLGDSEGVHAFFEKLTKETIEKLAKKPK